MTERSQLESRKKYKSVIAVMTVTLKEINASLNEHLSLQCTVTNALTFLSNIRLKTCFFKVCQEKPIPKSINKTKEHLIMLIQNFMNFQVKKK